MQYYPPVLPRLKKINNHLQNPFKCEDEWPAKEPDTPRETRSIASTNTEAAPSKNPFSPAAANVKRTIALSLKLEVCPGLMGDAGEVVGDQEDFQIAAIAEVAVFCGPE
jgi:hypothetical protein